MKEIKNMIILSSNYTLNCANNLYNYFKTLNIVPKLIINNKITYEILQEIKKENSYLFLLGINHIQNINNINLPKDKYIIYQIEQLNQTLYEYNKLSEEVIYLMKDCYSLFDYSNKNLEYYPEDLRERVLLLEPLIELEEELEKELEEELEKELEEELEKELDILFIGSINERRQAILDKLHEYSIDNRLYYNIKIVSTVFGKELSNLIKNSKLVINLHYFDNALLEIFRIHDLLSFNCKILSEIPGTEEEMKLVEKYDKVINFFPIIQDDFSNIDEMFKIITNSLDSKIDFVEKKKFIEDINKKNRKLLNKNT